MTRDNPSGWRSMPAPRSRSAVSRSTWIRSSRYQPPPNFVKEGDTRTSGYREQFGTDECWELDALSPTVIADLIRTEIESLIEPNAWAEALAHESRGRELLDAAAGNWALVEKLLRGKPR